MVDKIIQFSLKNKLLVLLGVVVLIAAGIDSLRHIPIDAVPDITNNQVQVVTVSPALAPQEVEQLITYPLEAKMTNVPGVVEVRSLSRYGLSVVTVVFRESVPVMLARQYIQEQINVAAAEIPTGLGSPELMPITTGLGEIYQYVLVVEPGFEHIYDPTELRTIQDWIVKRQLNGTRGIIEVSSFGGYVKQHEIAVDPTLLRAYNLTITDVLNAIEVNNANSGGSYIESGPYSFYIRTEGRVQSEADIGNVAVASRDQRVITIRDIADIRIGSAKRYGAMTMDGKGEVVGGITLMLKGANSSEALQNVQERIEVIIRSLPEGVTIYPYLDRSKLINKTTHTVRNNLLEGGAIVIIILLLMLGNLRAGIIVASIIPLSMLFAFIMMRLFGISANLMSLGAIDFGIVVDGAVIIVESLLHVLALGYLGKHLSQFEMDDTVRESASRIYRSAAFGIIIILVVFIPILTLQGIEGKTFRPMAQTFGFAILGSLILSLTYVPVAASLFLSKYVRDKRTFSSRLVGWLQSIYDPLLRVSLRVPVIVIGGALLLLVGAIISFSRMGAEFVPTLEEGDLAMQQTIKPGSSLEESIRTTSLAEQTLLENFPEVIHVVSKIGTAEVPTDPMAIEDADIMIILKDKDEWTSAATREGLIDKMKTALAGITWASYEFTQPIQLRFNELMTGAKTDISVKILGENTDTLASIADQIAIVIEGIPGAADIKVDQTEGLQQQVVTVDRTQLARYGITVDDVNRTIRAAYAGEEVGVMYENERKFDIVVRLTPLQRQVLDLDNLFIRSMDGQPVPVSAFARTEYKEGPMLISREQARRFINVGVNVRDRDVESLVDEIHQMIDTELSLPPGYEIQYGGQFENLVAARQRLLIAVPVALFLIFILLQVTFNSLKDALIIFAAIPLSAIGGIAALLIRGMPFSISSGIGFITLFGVSVLNGIVLVSAIKQTTQASSMSPKEIISSACITRLRPVLITALVAAFGFLPMALSTGNGAEVQRPLATVVIGGLISSTILTLFVLPALYAVFRKPAIKASTILTGLLLIANMGLIQSQPIDNFDDLREVALANNPALNNIDLRIQRIQQEERTIGQWDKLSLNYTGGNINTPLYDNLIEISQSIDHLFTKKAQRAFVDSQVEQVTSEQLLTLVRFENNLYKAYNSLAFETARLELLIEIRDSYQQILPQIDAQLEAGEVDIVTHGLARAELLSIGHRVRMQESIVENHERRLRTAAFLPDSTIIIPAVHLPVQIDTSRISTSIQAQRRVFQANIQSLIALSELEKSEAKRPNLSLGGFTQSFDKEFGYYGVNASVGFPLDRRTANARIDQLKIDQQIVDNDLTAFEAFNQMQTSNLLNRMEGLAASIDEYDTDFLTRNSELKSILNIQYENSSIDFIRYQQVRLQFLRIENAYLELIFEFNKNAIDLMYYTLKPFAS